MKFKTFFSYGKRLGLALLGVAAFAAVTAAGISLLGSATPKAEAGIIGFGSTPVYVDSGGAGIIGRTNTVTNSYYNYLYASNVVVPVSMAASASTNLWYRYDMSDYKDCDFQFTGGCVASGQTNTVSIVIGGNNDGSTNVQNLFTWSCGVTNAGLLTYTTNLSTANGQLGALKYLWVVSVATSAGNGTPVLTNWYIAINPK